MAHVGACDDGRFLVARHGFGHVYNLVGSVLVVDGEACPFVHRHQCGLVAHGRLQHRVAALPGEAVGIAHIAAQHPVVRALNLHGIVGHQLQLAHLCHQRGGGEEMVVCAALFGLVDAFRIVFGADVLVAHAEAYLAEGQRTAVFGEEDVVALALFGKRCGHHLLRVHVVIVAVGQVVFGASLQVALPQRP